LFLFFFEKTPRAAGFRPVSAPVAAAL